MLNYDNHTVRMSCLRLWQPFHRHAQFRWLTITIFSCHSYFVRINCLQIWQLSRRIPSVGDNHNVMHKCIFYVARIVKLPFIVVAVCMHIIVTTACIDTHYCYSASLYATSRWQQSLTCWHVYRCYGMCRNSSHVTRVAVSSCGFGVYWLTRKSEKFSRLLCKASCQVVSSSKQISARNLE